MIGSCNVVCDKECSLKSLKKINTKIKRCYVILANFPFSLTKLSNITEHNEKSASTIRWVNFFKHSEELHFLNQISLFFFNVDCC